MTTKLRTLVEVSTFFLVLISFDYNVEIHCLTKDGHAVDTDRNTAQAEIKIIKYPFEGPLLFRNK
ncbi:hypothetical protein [Flammeovirga kamogawensis]|uniref:Uncharacterized protein n=1 Tax=Flammeovirga kamogawensis TaxID=373891 RepID=A0ABX8H1C5_9BACT|nr:hypothetical protein [Flammeovirga kamogawensis]MBB6462566.1 hypothetical protein [Flammeovirga kamogawensis]QWG09685.1 hypothetical protein KM029_24080 [Flammeovirga kamogawensis]TRX65197.1 hypothetical protein EO216_21975 [Flammeovirga kamogawensis]